MNTNNHILSWKYKELSEESIKPPFTADNKLNRLLNYVGTKIRGEFKGNCLKQDPICLKQDPISFNHGKIVNIYIVYETKKNYNISSFPTLENCLFGAIKLTKHPDIDKYKYSGYGIGFDKRGIFFSLGTETGRNVIIFGVDMSLSPHIDNQKKDISILGRRQGPTQRLEHILTAEKLYSINSTENNKKFCWSLHYNAADIYFFVNGTEVIKFKAKDPEIVAYLLFSGNISKYISVGNMENTRLNGYVYEFSVDYDAIAVDDISDIHKYLMKKHDMKCLDLLKKCLL